MMKYHIYIFILVLHFGASAAQRQSNNQLLLNKIESQENLCGKSFKNKTREILRTTKSGSSKGNRQLDLNWKAIQPLFSGSDFDKIYLFDS